MPISNVHNNANSIIINDRNKRLFYANGGKYVHLQYYKKNKNNIKIINKKVKKLYSGKPKSQLYFINNLYYDLKRKKIIYVVVLQRSKPYK